MPTESSPSFLKKHWAEISFFAAIIALFLFLGYFKYLFDGPGGIHYIRQTDSLAFIDHYTENGHDFFKPGTLNLDSEEGNAACEFPIIYYFTSFLYAGFGKHYFFLRLINFLLVIAGLYHLFKLGEKVFKDRITALVLPFFLFTSTVFNYYAFNFLPDAAALGLTFIGWNLFYDSYKANSNNWWKPFLFFTLAGLIKVTYFISPIALVGYFSLEYLRSKNQVKLKSVLLMFLASVTIIIAWNIYAIVYNQYFETEYFTTGARPIWGMPTSEVNKTWDHIFNFWWNDYFAHSSQHLLAIFLLVNIVLFKKLKNIISLIYLMLIGATCYFLLFFSQFKDHDYYFLTLIPVIATVLGGGVMALQKAFENKCIHWGVQSILLVVIIVGINYSRQKVNARFENRIDNISSFSLSLEQGEFETYILPEGSKVLVLADPSKNGSLLVLERKGWTLPDLTYFTSDTLNYFKGKGLTHILAPSEVELNLIDVQLEHFQRSNHIVCNIYTFSSQ